MSKDGAKEMKEDEGRRDGRQTVKQNKAMEEE